MRISEQDLIGAGFTECPTLFDGKLMVKRFGDAKFNAYIRGGWTVWIDITQEDDEINSIQLHGVENIDDLNTLERLIGEPQQTFIPQGGFAPPIKLW